jgi:hypothetical protein
VTDYFDALETELRTAVPRVARRRWPLPRPTAGRLGLAMLVAAPVALAVLALVLLGRGSSVATRSVQSGGAAAGPAVAGSPRVRRAPLRLYGNGFGDVRFGAGTRAVYRLLLPRLGQPLTGTAGDATCGVDGQATWPIVLNPRTGRLIRHEEMSVDFAHNRVVGYQFGGADPHLHGRRVVTVNSVATARGLRIGDPLRRGRHLYGHTFHLSNAQGGSWSVRTPRGVLSGFAQVRSFPIGPSARVETIDAGDVGCPAVSP